MLGEREKYAAELEAKWRAGNRALAALDEHLDGPRVARRRRVTRSPTSRSTRTRTWRTRASFDLARYPAVQAWIERVAAGPGTSRSRHRRSVRRCPRGGDGLARAAAPLRRRAPGLRDALPPRARGGRRGDGSAARLRPARLDLDGRPRAPADAHLTVGAYPEAAVSRLLCRAGRIFEYWAHEACLRPDRGLPALQAAHGCTCASSTGGAASTTTTRR